MSLLDGYWEKEPWLLFVVFFVFKRRHVDGPGASDSAHFGNYISLKSSSFSYFGSDIVLRSFSLCSSQKPCLHDELLSSRKQRKHDETQFLIISEMMSTSRVLVIFHSRNNVALTRMIIF